MEGFTRREFIRLAGLMGGTSLFTGCHLFPYSGPIPEYISGAPASDPAETLQGVNDVYSVCGLCPGNCGIRCRVAQGKLVKIGGSPYHPISAEKPLAFETAPKEALLHGGSICAIGGSGVQSLYNPFRIARPLKRVGPRGSGKWQALSWEAAIREILEGGDLFGEGKIAGLKSIKESQGATAFLAGTIDWGSTTFIKRFLAALPGSSFHRDDSVVLAEKAREATDAVFGSGTGPVDADYRNARFVLSFGDAPLDSGVPLVSKGRDIASSRVNSGGFQWAVVDPRLSTSASKADMWIPVIPGKDQDLVLGIMRLLADRFPDRARFPHQELETAVRKRTGQQYADSCGISLETIAKIAELLAASGRHSAAIPGKGVLAQPNGVETAKAVLSLNLMVGSVPGSGGLTRKPDDFIKIAEKKLLDGRKEQIIGQRYGSPVDALLLWESDPVYSDPASASQYFADRKKVPLLVAIDREITETAAYADYILPDTSYLERWDLCLSPASVPEPGIGVRSPVVGGLDAKTGKYYPIFPETRPMEDIIFQVAAGLALEGFKTSPAVGFMSTWQYYQGALNVVLESMKESGLPVSSSKEAVGNTIRRGGVFLPRARSMASVSAQSSADEYQPPQLENGSNAATPVEGSFAMITYTLPFHRAPKSGLNSWLLEVLPENRILINTADAQKLHIHYGDTITLETPDGKISITCKAHAMPGIRPGVVALAGGFGYTQAGGQQYTVDSVVTRANTPRKAGVNPASLKTDRGPLRVKIRKA